MNTLVLKRTPWERFKKGLFKYWEYYLMLIPGFALLIIFSYAPMYGIMLAFKNLRMKKGIWGSPWANPWYLHFKTFFDSPYAYRLLRNTLIISITKVVLPLSLPVIMSVTLFFMVDYWNSYYSYVYYCYDPDLRPLQVVLREIIKKATGDAEAEEYVPTITVQMSAIVFACIPIICVYPFLQKYFTKGVMLGAIKG